MSKITDLAVPDSILDDLRCSLCKGYLSCAPVQVIADGTSICGRCITPPDRSPSYRQLTFESILNHILFPCQFKKCGCEKLLPFGHADVHEAICDYRPVSCPSLPPRICSWEGSALDVPGHITQEHQELLVDNLRFIVEQFQDKDEVMMTVVNGVNVIVKYMYSSITSTLSYHVQYFPLHKQNASYSIRLINDFEDNYSRILNGGECTLYTDFYEMQSWKMLLINDYLESLNNPNRIAVQIDLSVSCNQKATISSSEYPALSIPKCNSDWSASKLNTTKDAGFSHSCRWPKCNFVGQADSVLEHEMSCYRCLYECPFSGWCNETTFTQSDAIKHLEEHNGQYFVDRLTYETWLGNCYGNQNFFTLKHSRVVLFCHLNTKKPNGQYQHEVVFKVSSVDGLPNVVCKLRFEHSHCRVKSRIFILHPHSRLQIDIGDFPRCFRPEQLLTATLKIERE